MDSCVDSICVSGEDSLDFLTEVVNGDHIVVSFEVEMLTITRFSVVIC